MEETFKGIFASIGAAYVSYLLIRVALKVTNYKLEINDDRLGVHYEL